MKLLLFIPQIYQLGGAESLSFNLAIELKKRNVNVSVCLLYSHDKDDCQNLTRLRELGIPIYNLDMPVGVNRIAYFKYILKLRSILKNNRFDFCESTSVICSLTLSFASWGLDVVCVFGVHQVFLDSREQSINHKMFKKIIPRVKNAKFYFISSYVEYKSLEFFESKRLNGCVIYNAIDESFFDDPVERVRSKIAKKYSLSPNTKVVVYCGRFAEYKGVKLVYDVFRKIKEDNPGSDMRLFFVGAVDSTIPGTNRVYDCIRRDRMSLSEPSIVDFTGHVDKQEVFEWLSIADVLLHPTSIEGFGLTLAEASSLGTFVVTSRAEAIPEVLEGTTAVLLDDFDEDLYKRVVEEAIFFPKLSRHDRQLYNKKALSRYRTEARVNSFIDFLKS